MPSQPAPPALHELAAWSPYQQQTSAAWVIESPIAAIRVGGRGLPDRALARCGAVSEVEITTAASVTARATVTSAVCWGRPTYITPSVPAKRTATWWIERITFSILPSTPLRVFQSQPPTRTCCGGCLSLEGGNRPGTGHVA